MNKKMAANLVAQVEARILVLRGQRVMLSPHLAELYGVQPKVLVQAVKRNASRFPEDFMFQLSREEFSNLKSQIVTSSWGGLRRAAPYAFTEQGVAMLSSILGPYSRPFVSSWRRRRGRDGPSVFGSRRRGQPIA
jgi:ORF6N domain-containing protein